MAVLRYVCSGSFTRSEMYRDVVGPGNTAGLENEKMTSGRAGKQGRRRPLQGVPSKRGNLGRARARLCSRSIEVLKNSSSDAVMLLLQ